MARALTIGGEPVVTLRPSTRRAAGPAFLEAIVLPGRGHDAAAGAACGCPRARSSTPSPRPTRVAAARSLDGGPTTSRATQLQLRRRDPGALRQPHPGPAACPGAREIETEVAGETVRLPRNWGGKAPGAEQYAMHGLILDARGRAGGRRRRIG